MISMQQQREANYYRELVSMEGLDGYMDKQELQHVVLEKHMYRITRLAKTPPTRTEHTYWQLTVVHTCVSHS